MTTESLIQKNVMRRVRTVHALRPFTGPSVLAACLFLLALWGIGREVWVAQVLANMPSLVELDAFARFFVAAFLETEFMVQVLTLAVLAAGVWFVHDVARSLQYVTRTA